MNVGDAGVYYHSEQYVFPNDKGGIPNAFILKVEDMETDDKDRRRKHILPKLTFGMEVLINLNSKFLNK